MIDRTHFFDTVRPLFKTLTQSHVDGFTHLLDTWEGSYASYPLAYLAYALATAYHETAHTMQPVPEIGRGKGRAYGNPVNGRTYYGRGYVQLTWLRNYQVAKDKLGPDFVTKPDLALDPVLAAKIMYQGMIDGWFTGKKLSGYFDGKSDPVGARRIINGTDRAALIAGYHATFLKALILVADAAPQAAPASTPTHTPTPLGAAILSLFSLFRRKG